MINNRGEREEERKERKGESRLRTPILGKERERCDTGVNKKKKAELD